MRGDDARRPLTRAQRDARARSRSRARSRARARMYRRRRLVVLTAAVALVAGLVTVVGRLPLGSAPATAPTASNADADGPPPAARRVAETSATTARPAPGPPATTPETVDVPQHGTGTLQPVHIALPANTDRGRVVSYRVEVEQGVPFDGVQFARTVHAILGNRQGWQGVEDVAFRLVDGGSVDLTVTLASPEETDRLCAPLRTEGEVSCWNGTRSVINAKRWAQGSPTYGDDLENYRRYLIGHEVGHGLDRHHVSCPAPGEPAPVMVQQTISLEGCTANPWPAINH